VTGAGLFNAYASGILLARASLDTSHNIEAGDLAPKFPHWSFETPILVMI